jgi:hypothetical protein
MSGMKSSTLKFALITLLIAATGSVFGINKIDPDLQRNQHYIAKSSSGELTPLISIPAGVIPVTLGIYAINIYDLDLKANTYYISFYAWLRWKGDCDPVSTLEFTNAVENWGLTTILLTEKPDTLADGSLCQSLRINSRFYQNFDLSRYPIDRQALTIIAENTDESAGIIYIPDTVASGFGQEVNLPGWKVNGLQAEAYVHHYGSDFGELGNKLASDYSTVKFSFDLNRPFSFFLWKILFPLIIVMMTSWIALLLSPTRIEARTALPSAALLSMIFLRDGAMMALPENSTLLLLDKIYVLSYVFIVLTLIHVMWVNLKINMDSPESVARMGTIDAISVKLQVAAFAIGMVLLMWL